MKILNYLRMVRKTACPQFPADNLRTTKIRVVVVNPKKNKLRLYILNMSLNFLNWSVPMKYFSITFLLSTPVVHRVKCSLSHTPSHHHYHNHNLIHSTATANIQHEGRLCLENHIKLITHSDRFKSINKSMVISILSPYDHFKLCNFGGNICSPFQGPRRSKEILSLC